MAKRVTKTKRQRIEEKPVKLRKGYKKAVKMASPSTIRMLERRRNVLQMRQKGWSYDEIASALNIGVETARKDVVYCLNLSATELCETAVEERELQKARLDAMLKPNFQFATEYRNEIRIDNKTGKEFVVVCPPDPSFANTVLKIEERRSKLLALDVPETKKVEISGVREYNGIDINKI